MKFPKLNRKWLLVAILAGMSTALLYVGATTPPHERPDTIMDRPKETPTDRCFRISMCCDRGSSAEEECGICIKLYDLKTHKRIKKLFFWALDTAQTYLQISDLMNNECE